MLLVEAHQGARALLYATFAVGIAAEVAVTVYRRGGDAFRARGSSLDRGTKRVLALFLRSGSASHWAAGSPPPRRSS